MSEILEFPSVSEIQRRYLLKGLISAVERHSGPVDAQLQDELKDVVSSYDAVRDHIVNECQRRLIDLLTAEVVPPEFMKDWFTSTPTRARKERIDKIDKQTT